MEYRIGVKMRRTFLLVLALTVFGCSGPEQSRKEEVRRRNEKKEKIHRLSREVRYSLLPLVPKVREPYPWEEGYSGGLPPVTQEAFRCKGCSTSPVKGGIRDCTGMHGLPLRGRKEFIYPVLLEVLNYIQHKTGRSVIVTSGHQCPDHHRYSDSSAYHARSKHMIGAEVDFYVSGMEEKPEEVIDWVIRYFSEKEPYRGKTEYTTFVPLDSIKTDTRNVPRYNKEILVKLYQKDEGRDPDNLHPYPYVCIQVRLDRETGEKVVYSSEKAYGGYLLERK